MKKIILILVVLIAASLAWVNLAPRAASLISAGEHALYQCPMHPQIIQDHPGNCPICGMRLNRVEKTNQSAVSETQKQKKVAFYRHPMRPDVSSPVPAKDEMGMDYIPVYESENEMLPDSDVDGHATVRLDAEKIQLIGIRTTESKVESLILPLRVTGTVFHNHQIYEMLTAYRDAIQVEQRVKKPTPDLINQSRVTARNLRIQLGRLGISDDVFKKAEESLEDPTSFIPAHLIVAANGAYVDARLNAADAIHLKLGQKAKLSSPAFLGHEIEGIVKSVDSVVDTETQTLGVRIEAQTGHEWMKPGLFVNVEMELDLGERLSVPNTAVLNPGKQAYVFIEKSAGVYVPRHVETGIAAGNEIEILSGLKPSEKVVTLANFLLDSESRVQSARNEAGHD